MLRTTPIQDLEIVGYANTLAPEQTPTVVAPVYRAADGSGGLLFPPFDHYDAFVVGGTAGTEDDLDSLVSRGKATRLALPIPARSDHELWIDHDLHPHYGNGEEVEDHLRRVATSAIEAAEAALRSRDLAAADAACTEALAADDGQIAPLAIKAAIRGLQGQFRHASLFRDLAARFCNASDFDALVHRYRSLASSGKLDGIAAEHPVLPEAT